MNITELCAAIGPENILIQPLNDAVTGITKKKIGHSVTFTTDQLTCADFVNEHPRKVGLVLWIGKEHIDRIKEPTPAERLGQGE